MLPVTTMDPTALAASPGTVQTTANTVSAPCRTWRYDLDTGRIGGMTDGKDTMAQAIYKRLRTPRGKHPIYSAAYGSALWELNGQDGAYVRAMAPVLIREALEEDARILEVSDFQFEQEHAILYCRFTVYTVWGTMALRTAVSGEAATT